MFFREDVFALDLASLFEHFEWTIWSGISGDLNSLNFYVWGYINFTVYAAVLNDLSSIVQNVNFKNVW
jgi:hypothetical protein